MRTQEPSKPKSSPLIANQAKKDDSSKDASQDIKGKTLDANQHRATNDFNFNKMPLLPETPRNKNLPRDLQLKMEGSFGTNFSNVQIHKNSNRATELDALAFTQGENVHFAPGEFNPSSQKGKELIGHEFAHVVQQRSGVVQPTAVMGKGINLNDDRGLEREADGFGNKAIKGKSINKYRSVGLGLRNTLRSSIQAKSNVIQRDIRGSKELGSGKMEVDFTKTDATKKGDQASELGIVKFTPNETAPKSNNIRLIQIVRTTDKSSSKEKDYEWTGGEANRNKVITTNNSKKNVAGGFFIDHLAGSVSPRTKKSDATISPYYRDYAPNVGLSQDGHKKSKTDIQPASLADRPGDSAPGRFLFVTSAKAADNGTWYGTALWGFEIYVEKGIAKIKNEYKSFRENRGATTDAALEKFNEFYKNPGTSGAPKK